MPHGQKTARSAIALTFVVAMATATMSARETAHGAGGHGSDGHISPGQSGSNCGNRANDHASAQGRERSLHDCGEDGSASGGGPIDNYLPPDLGNAGTTPFESQLVSNGVPRGPAQIPEPASTILVGAGLVSVLVRMRRTNRR